MGRLMRAEDHDEATILGTEPTPEPAPEPTPEPAPEPTPELEPEPEPNALLGAPEGDYEIDVAALPEGTKIDTEALAVLTPVAKEIDLSNAGMTKLAVVYATKILPALDARVTESIETQAAQQRKDWEAETRLAISGGKGADGKVVEALKDDKGEPIYGGLPYKDVVATAARALDRFGGPGLREALDASGYGNRESMMRFAFTVGRAIKEDDFDRGSGPSEKPKSLTEALYGTKAE